MTIGPRTSRRLLTALLLFALLLALLPTPPSQAAPSPAPAAAAPAQSGPGLGERIIHAVGVVFQRLGELLATGAPPSLHDVSPSTPWTAFTLGVNIVGGNLVSQHTDLRIPSIGFATSVGRTYNSAAAAGAGPFGYGWFWSYGMQVTAGSGSATVIRGDGRADTYTLTNGSYMPPTGIYDQLAQNQDATYTLTLADQTKYTFATSGQLQQIADPNGNVLKLSYTGTTPSGITDTAGRSWAIQTDSSSRITKITDPAGRGVSYAYSSGGDLTTVTDANGGVTAYAYDGSHRLTSISDPNQHATTYAYDGSGRVSTVTDAANDTSSFAYDTTNSRTTVTDPRGNTRSYTFDGSNRVIAVADGLGKSETSTWDANNNRTATTDRNGNTTSYVYDSRGNVTLVTDALGGKTATIYDSQNHPTSQTDALNRTTTLTYDANGNLTSVKDPASNTTQYAYDAKGERTSMTDANGNVTTYAYDASGNQTSVADAMNEKTVSAYDAAGNVTSVTDPDGRVTSHTYDALGHVLTTADGAGGVTKLTYDGAGNVLTTTDPLGNKTTNAYDARNLLVSVTDALANVTTTSYDGDGNKNKVTDPLGHATTFAYDADNRLTSTTDANGHPTSYTYDANGNQTTKTDANNHTSSYAYDALNRLKQVTDAKGGQATYAYDAAGNRTSITDPDHVTTTTAYDALDRPTSETNPTSGNLAYAYDKVGNLLSKTDGNANVTKYVYDKSNRVTAAQYPEGTVTYTYDGAGDVATMTDPTGTTTYSYDGARRLTSNAAPTGTTTYAYDKAGNVTSVTYPSDGAQPGTNVVTYGYDADARLTAVTDWNGKTTGYAYDAASRKTAITQPNGVHAAYSYDPANQVQTLQWTSSAGATVASFAYTYDAVGNTTKIVDTTGTSTYAYDELDRLTQATYPDGTSTSYTYDAAGNRTSTASGGVTTSYTYDGNERLTAVGTDKVQTDGNGNVTSRGAISYTYDSQNRLLQVVTPSQSVMMGYDGANHRVAKVAGGVSTGYAYDDHGPLARVLKESNSQGSQLYGLDGQIIWDSTSGQGQLYYHQDAMGSTVAVTKPDGSVAATMTYDAFGAPRSPITIRGSFWFDGEQYDQEDGLIYLRARYYDPTTGRFLSADPARPDYMNSQSLNRYAYARNNPLRFSDPSGNYSLDDALKVTEGIGITSGILAISIGAIAAAGGCVVSVVCGIGVAALVTSGIATGAALDIHATQYAGKHSQDSSVSRIFGFLGSNWPEIVETALIPLGGVDEATLKAIGNARFFGNYKLLTYSDVAKIMRVKDWYDRADDINQIASAITYFLGGGDRTGATGSTVTSSHGGGNVCLAILACVAGQQPNTESPNPSSNVPGRRSTSIIPVFGGAYVAPGSPPNKPTNLAPANGAAVSSGGFTLQWQANGSASGTSVAASQVSLFGPGNSNLYLQSDWISGTTFTPPTIPWGTYTWSVRVKDSKGLISSPSDAWSLAVGAGADVWDARYFADTTLSSQCTELFEGGTFVFHDWGTGAPGPTDQNGNHPCPADNFSARFTKTVHLKAGTYNFALFSDDWGRIFVNGDLVVNNWQGAGQHYESRTLAEGDYTITVEYADTLGNAIIQAWWTGPDYAIPADSQDPNQWYAIYWANKGLWQDGVVKVNEGSGALYHDWGDGSPGWGLPADQFSARFQRTVNLVSGQYKFTVVQDDGARVYVDGTLVSGLDNWSDAPGTYSGTATLTSGSHVITVEYFEDGGAAKIGLSWSLVSGATSCTPTPTVSPTPTSTSTGSSFDLGTGADGALTVTGVQTVNVETSASGSAGCAELYLGSGSGFNPGDEVLISQTQGSGAGAYEFRRIASVSANVLTLTQPLTSTYGGSGPAQAIRVPNYTNVTVPSGAQLVAPPWNGSSGGVLALRANGKLDVQAGGMLVADGVGFHGGAGWGSGDNTTAMSGEGTPGPGGQTTAANGNGGGASHGGGGESAAAGGGYGTSGLAGLCPNNCSYAQPAQPGAAVGDAALAALDFGGGGGGGNNINDPGAPAGGNGGGAILVAANLINVAGGVSAQGNSGQPGVANAGSHGGAGGAGGAIRLQANTLSLAGGAVNATGGAGGAGTYSTGGAGGTGRVRFEYGIAQGNATVNPPPSTKVVTPPSHSGGGYGTGADGALLVTDNQTVNIWTSAAGLAGSEQLALGSSAGFGVGDEVLVAQTQGGTAGPHEFDRIASINGNTLTLTQPLINSYAGPAQAVRVPNYTTVTIQSGGMLTAKAWDGTSGGILVFRASTSVDVQAGGRIVADGTGFRGGPGRGSGDNTTSTQGEGYPGPGVISTAANGNGGGAAHAGGGESSAAGGGYGTAGASGTGQYSALAQGGAAVGDPALTTVFFGGGGGGGNNINDPGSPNGGSGGGAVLIFGKGVTVTGMITAVGANGQAGTTSGGSHGGAGGAGGAILIQTDTLTLNNGTITALGGVGGSGTYSTGGHGGDGRIRFVFATEQGNATVSPVASTEQSTPTPTPTVAPTTTASPTATPTLTPTATPDATPTPTATPEATPTASATSSPSSGTPTPTPSGSSGSPRTLASVGGASAATAYGGERHLLFASDGTAWAAWWNDSAIVFATAGSPYTAWSPPTTLIATNDPDRSQFDAKIDAADTIHVLMKDLATNMWVYVPLTKHGTTWTAGTMSTVSTTGAGATPGYLLLDPDFATNHRLWTVTYHTHGTIDSFYSTDGATWTASQVGSTYTYPGSAGYAYFTGFFVGTYLVEVRATSNGLATSYLDTRASLTAWSAEQLVTYAGASGYAHLAAASDSNNVGIVAITPVGSASTVGAASLITFTVGFTAPTGGTPVWTQSATLDTAATQPSLIRRGNDVVALWAQQQGTSSYALVGRTWTASSATWETATTILEAAGANQQWPNAALAGTTLAYTWTAGTANPYTVRFDAPGIAQTSPTATATAGATTTATPSPSPTATSSPTATPEPTPSPTVTATPTPTLTPSPSPTSTPTPNPAFGTGADGPLAVSGSLAINQTRHPATGTAGSSTLTIGAGTGTFAAGQQVMVWQTQGANAGVYEFASVASISGNQLLLSSPLVNTYVQGAQVIQVPLYTDVTVPPGAILGAPAWDGTTGGVAVFRATGTVNVQSGGKIAMDSSGFRGGNAGNDDSNTQGEGDPGSGTHNSAPNDDGGGAGHASEGGGGGNGTAGGGGCQNAVCGSAGGNAVGDPDLARLFLGGGGGGGGSNGCGSSNGGAGGGVVLIFAANVTVSGSLTANGAPGPNACERPGGGGAGGSIYLVGNQVTLGNNLVDAIGGSGGTGGTGCSTCFGGAGGAGRIRVDDQTMSGATNPPATTHVLSATVQLRGARALSTPTTTRTAPATAGPRASALNTGGADLAFADQRPAAAPTAPPAAADACASDAILEKLACLVGLG